MDGKRFDDLTRSLSRRQSRRGVIKTLGAGIAAGLGALGFGSADAAPGGKGKGKGAQCGGPGKQCKRNAQCCEFAGLVCLDGTCSCPENTCSSGACHGECPAGKVFNPVSCSCECDEPAACNNRQVLNPDTCSCDCAPCPEGLLLDGESCACLCPETNTCCHCYIAATETSFCTTGGTYEGCEEFCAAGGGTLSSWDDTGVFLFEGCSSGFCGIACRSIYPEFPD